MNARRELAAAVGLCLAGAGLLLLGLSRAWVVVEERGSLTITAFHKTVTGVALEPGLRALGLVALVGVLALAATRRSGRVVTGALLAGAGVWAAVLAGQRLDSARLVDEAGRHLHSCATNGPSCSRPVGVELPTLVAHTGPLWLCLVGAVLVAAAGLLTAARGSGWAGLGAAYDAPSAPSQEPASDKGVWDALDRGDDPTA